MKAIYLISLLFTFSLIQTTIFGQTACTTGQAQADLDVNNIKAALYAGSDLWWNRSEGRYIVPQPAPGEPEVSSVFAGGIWIAGVDPGGNLKIAASTYGAASNSSDFWPGPLSPDNGVTSKPNCQNFDRLWKVNRAEIDAHIADFEDNGIIDGPAPQSVISWPGRNNPESLVANDFSLPDQTLAPFVDRNGNGIYEPFSGDYPEVKGDQAIWWVFNDQGGGAIHSETVGVALQVEIQGLAYAYTGANNVNLANTTFYEFSIYNRALEDLDSAFVSLWLDGDIGCYLDDYIGCEPAGRLAYFYNADEVDGTTGCICDSGAPTYCEDIPVLGVKVLEGPKNPLGEDTGFSSFIYFNANQFPNFSSGNYSMMTGHWPDGTPITIGGDGYNPSGGETTNYVFPDSPADPNGWSMCTENFPAYDRRVLINSGPFELMPGQKTSVTYAVMSLFGLDYPCPDITPLLDMGEEVQNFFDNLTGVENPATEFPEIQFSPNPLHSEGRLMIKKTGAMMQQVLLFSGDGRLIRRYDIAKTTELTIERNDLPGGLYFYKILMENGQWVTGKVVMQ